MKRKNTSGTSEKIDGRLIRLVVGAKPVLALVALFALCTYALAEENTTGYGAHRVKKLFINSSLINETVASYDKALQADPGNASAWIDKAQSLFILGKPNESIKALQSALDAANESLKKNSQDVNAWQNRGIALASIGQNAEANRSFEMAIEILNQSIEKNPDDVEAWWLKAESYELMGRNEDAVRAYDKVIELNSTKAAGAWIRESDLLDSLGKHNESMQAFDNAVDLATNGATGGKVECISPVNGSFIVIDAWGDRGQILRVDVGEYNESIKNYKRFFRMDSNYVGAWRSKKNANLMGELYEAVRTYNSAIEQNPQDQVALTLKGNVLSELGRYNESLIAFDKALQIDPGYAYAWLCKGEALNKTGRYEEAIKAYDKAIEIDPKNPHAWQDKGLALNAIGNNAESEAAFAKS